MKKKIILILFISCILCGCTSVQSKSIESIVNESVSKNLRVYNTYRKGYKYNLAKGLCSVDSSDFNEVIASRDYKYYLYVDGVSYYNKVIEKYEERKGPYFSMAIVHEDKYGYLEINKLKNKDYFIEIMYNYAKIEVVVKEEDIKEAVAYSMSILKSVTFNNNILKNVLGDETTQAREFDFNIFETASSKNSEYLEAIDADIYQEEDDSVHDSDLIEPRGDNNARK